MGPRPLVVLPSMTGKGVAWRIPCVPVADDESGQGAHSRQGDLPLVAFLGLAFP